MERMEQIGPDAIIYVVDKRQELYFEQVFRCARKTGLVKPETALQFLGFGTVNGPDGKAFKTREGGVMRLETLIGDINERMYEKITSGEGEKMSPEEARRTAEQAALAAVKYGDLSNQASKDYIFDIAKFSSSEGDTGPYILYTIARIKSILRKYAEQGGAPQAAALREAQSASEKSLMMELAGFQTMVETAFADTAPHKVCAYIYNLSNVFNHFYHEQNILKEEDAEKKAGWIALLMLTGAILETCIDLLGFSAPERM